MRGRSYTPSPPRGYGRRGGRSPPPRGGRYGRAADAPTSLLVRNLRLDCRPEDLKRPFGQFGPVKDVYLPRDYYTGDARGFGFVQYVDPADAAEAKYQMDGSVLHGRELTVVFAEENRKKPTEMRARERGGGSRGRSYDRRRSPSRYSRSPPRNSQSRGRDYYSPPKRRYSRSISPNEKRYSRERSYSRSPVREHKNHSPSPVRVERSPYGSRSRSQSPGPVGPARGGHSPVRARSPVRAARSPVRGRSISRSRSRSPPPHHHPVEYTRGPPRRDRSPSQ